MTVKILDGQALSQIMQAEIHQAIAKRQQSHLSTPGLDVILIGHDPASEVYVYRKQNACKKVGIKSTLHRLPMDTTEEQLLDLIRILNASHHVHGILLQLPLPKHLNETRFLEAISPKKDVDGFHPYNLGRLLQRRPLLRPCTPLGIIKLLRHYQINCQGQHAVIVGASNIVGRPLSMEFLLEGTTVTVCHRFTKNLDHFVRQADILVSATGKRNLIKSDWIKSGAVVIDVGIHRLKSGSIVGDIDFDSAAKRASAITPVPGGVGPMTVATLLENTLTAAQSQA